MINKKVLPIREYSFREKLKKEREEERRVKEVAKGNELAGRAVNTSEFLFPSLKAVFVSSWLM